MTLVADETKKVEYVFQGDTSSLEKATQDAINWLGKYENAVKDLNQAGKFEVSKTAFGSFNRTINSITSQVNSLVKSLNKASKEAQVALSPDATKIQAASSDLRSVLEMLQSSSSVNSKDLQFITEYLKDTQKSLSAVADKASVVTANFKDISRLQLPRFEDTTKKDLDNVANAAHTAAEVTKESTHEMSSAYKSMVKNAPFINYAREVEQAYGRVSKSARESAAVLTSEKAVQFEDKLDKIRTKSAEAAEGIRNAFDRLADMFSPMAAGAQQASAKLESFKAKAAEVLDHIKQTAEAAGSGFRQFKGDVEEASDSDAAGSSKLVGVLKTLQSIMSGVSSAADKKSGSLKDETAETLSDLASTNKFVAALKILVQIVRTAATGISNAVKAFISLKKTIDSVKSKTDSVSSDLKKFISLLGGMGVGKALGEATKAAIAYIENLNLFTVAMGESIDEAKEFVSRMSEIYGMDPSNLYRYSGYFYQMSDAIGTASEASKIMSLSLTKAANDISSLFNQDIETVVNNLASGIQGMSRAVRKYGMDIRVTTLQQTALTYGLTENVSTMSEANRMALRYLTMMHQVKNATSQVTETVDGATKVMGDFARNIETPANQLRILKEQISQLARAFGNFLIPVLQKTLYVINGILMALKELLLFFAKLIGIDLDAFGGEISGAASEAADGVSGIGEAADKTAKKLRNLIAPFDELTILTEPKDDEDSSLSGISSDALDPRLLEAIENMSLGLDEIRMKALDVRDKILELLGLEWDKDGNLVVTVNGFIDDLMHLWDNADYTGFGLRIAEFLNQGIQWGIKHVDPSVYAPIISEKVAILAKILNGLVEGFDWEGLGVIFGNGFNIALAALDTWLTTFDFKQLGASIANLFNGLVRSVDWELFGKTLGDYVMAQIRQLQGFFETFSWYELGTSLARGFMSMLDAIQWAEIGHLIATQVNSVVDSVRAFFRNYEWGTLGSNLAKLISTAVREINWHNLGATISDVVRALFRDVTNFLGELDWFSIGKAISEFLMAIDWFGLLSDVVVAVITILGAVVRGLLGLIVGIFTGIGKDIAEGFQGGILEGLKNIGNWLWEHLCEPVIRAVKGFFGIHSPSTVFAEIGGFLIEGLLEGLLNALKNIGNWFKTNLVDPVIKAVKTGFSMSGDKSTMFQNLGTSIVNGLLTGLQSITSRLSSWGSSLRSSISGIVNGIRSTISSFVSSVQSTLSGLVSSATAKARSIANTVNSALSSTRKVGTSISTSSSFGKYPRMATGGVVRGPTHALIGEGQYSEAVIPLGNSPELQEMIDKIADAVSATPRSGNDAQTPIEVHVYLDGTEITSSQNKTNRIYGRTQQNL